MSCPVGNARRILDKDGSASVIAPEGQHQRPIVDRPLSLTRSQKRRSARRSKSIRLVAAGTALSLMLAACTTVPLPTSWLQTASTTPKSAGITLTVKPSPTRYVTLTPTPPPRPTRTPRPTATFIPLPTHDPAFDQFPLILVENKEVGFETSPGLENLFWEKPMDFGYLTPEMEAQNAENARLGRIATEYMLIYPDFIPEAWQQRAIGQPLDFSKIPPSFNCTAEQTVKMALKIASGNLNGSSIYLTPYAGVEEFNILSIATGETRTFQVDGATLTAVRAIYVVPDFHLRTAWIVMKADLDDGSVIRLGYNPATAEDVFSRVTDSQILQPTVLQFEWLVGSRVNNQARWDNAREIARLYSLYRGVPQDFDVLTPIERAFAWQAEIESGAPGGSQAFFNGEQPPDNYLIVPSTLFVGVFTDPWAVDDLYNIRLPELVQCVSP